MAVNATGAPETITRAELIDWLASVGIDASNVFEIHLVSGELRATVFARDDEGNRYLASPQSRLFAKHDIHIRIVDGEASDV